MQPVVLEVAQREGKLGRGYLNNLRKEGILPGVIYGKEIEPLSFTVPKKEFLKLLESHGPNVILGVKVENTPPIQAMVKDIQKHPVTGHYWHLDLTQISLNQSIRTSVPVVFEGEPIGVAQGGFIQYGDTNIEVECLPMELPQNIAVDIGHLEIGQKIVLGDLKLSDEITVIGEPEKIIVSIAPPAKEEVAEAEVGEEATTEAEASPLEGNEEEAEKE